MGIHNGGGPSSPAGKLATHIAKLRGKYGADSKGRLGRPSKNRVNVIESQDPQSEAKLVWKMLSQGSTISPLPAGKGFLGVFNENEIVTFRPKSNSDGSPAIDIKISSDTYRIHFVGTSGKLK